MVGSGLTRAKRKSTIYFLDHDRTGSPWHVPFFSRHACKVGVTVAGLTFTRKRLQQIQLGLGSFNASHR
jgi:hypothetical protein